MSNKSVPLCELFVCVKFGQSAFARGEEISSRLHVQTRAAMTVCQIANNGLGWASNLTETSIFQRKL